MLHHLSLGVRDVSRSMAFYDAALQPLGYVRVWTRDDAAGYGRSGPDEPFAIKQRQGAAAPGAGFHLAFAAETPGAVDAFYARALQAGGRDDGAPGLRPHYGAGYYAAFVVDPDGHRLEAVCDETSGRAKIPGVGDSPGPGRSAVHSG